MEFRFAAPPPRAWKFGEVAARLPPMEGKPIRIEGPEGLKGRPGGIHAGAFLRERRVAFDCEPAEFARIFVHEIFHFVWLRLGNGARREYQELVREEWKARARGELGWSAEWRKAAMGREDVRRRSRRWREYCCESFCDTAAWLYCGRAGHEEFTLAGKYRARRRKWFQGTLEARRLTI